MSIWENLKQSLNPFAEAADDIRDGGGAVDYKGGRRRSYLDNGFTLGGLYYTGTSWNYTALYRCMTLLSSAVATPAIYIRDKLTKKRVDPDSLPDRGSNSLAGVRLWARVFGGNNLIDGNQDQYRFRESMMLELLDRGNVYIHRDGDTLKLVRLIGDERGYVCRVSDQQGHYFETMVLDLIHIAMPARRVFDGRYLGGSHSHFIKGHPPALVVKTASQTGSAINDYVLDYLTQSIMPADAFVFADKMDEEHIKNSQQKVNLQADIPRPLVLGAKAEHSHYQLTTGADEATKLDTTRDKNVEEIARAFGIPPPLIGLATGAWAQGINQLNWKYERHTLNPYFKRVESALSAALLPPDYEFWHNRSEYRLGDVGDLIQMLPHVLGNEKQGKRPLLTIDEMREFFGLFPGEIPKKAPMPMPDDNGA